MKVDQGVIFSSGFLRWGDENVLEVNSDGSFVTLQMNILETTEVYILKG